MNYTIYKKLYNNYIKEPLRFIELEKPFMGGDYIAEPLLFIEFERPFVGGGDYIAEPLRIIELEDNYKYGILMGGSRIIPPKDDVKPIDIEAVNVDGLALQFATKEQQENLLFAVAAFKQNGLALQFASEYLRGHMLGVRYAVNNNGLALKFASKDQKGDITTVKIAVNNDGLALKFASEAIQDDIVTVREAVKQNGIALKFASEAIQDDIVAVREAVKQNGIALQFASEAIQDDIVTVREAVKQNGIALQFASEAIQDDIVTVREAVTQNGLALEYATYISNMWVIVAAVKQNKQIEIRVTEQAIMYLFKCQQDEEAAYGLDEKSADAVALTRNPGEMRDNIMKYKEDVIREQIHTAIQDVIRDDNSSTKGIVFICVHSLAADSIAWYKEILYYFALYNNLQEFKHKNQVRLFILGPAEIKEILRRKTTEHKQPLVSMAGDHDDYAFNNMENWDNNYNYIGTFTIDSLDKINFLIQLHNPDKIHYHFLTHGCNTYISTSIQGDYIDARKIILYCILPPSIRATNKKRTILLHTDSCKGGNFINNIYDIYNEVSINVPNISNLNVYLTADIIDNNIPNIWKSSITNQTLAYYYTHTILSALVCDEESPIITFGDMFNSTGLLHNNGGLLVLYTIYEKALPTFLTMLKNGAYFTVEEDNSIMAECFFYLYNQVITNALLTNIEKYLILFLKNVLYTEEQPLRMFSHPAKIFSTTLLGYMARYKDYYEKQLKLIEDNVKLAFKDPYQIFNIKDPYHIVMPPIKAPQDSSSETLEERTKSFSGTFGLIPIVLTITFTARGEDVDNENFQTKQTTTAYRHIRWDLKNQFGFYKFTVSTVSTVLYDTKDYIQLDGLAFKLTKNKTTEDIERIRGRGGYGGREDKGEDKGEDSSTILGSEDEWTLSESGYDKHFNEYIYTQLRIETDASGNKLFKSLINNIIAHNNKYKNLAITYNCKAANMDTKLEQIFGPPIDDIRDFDCKPFMKTNSKQEFVVVEE